MLNFEVTSFCSFLDIKKNHFVTAEAAADLDDSIKRKRIRVSLKKHISSRLECSLYENNICGRQNPGV